MAETRSRVGHLLAELAAVVGTPLDLDERGILTVRLDRASLTLELPEDSDTLYLHAPIRRLVGAGAEAVLRDALARNLFALAVPGSWLALDPATEEILLCATVPVAGLTADELALRLTTLAEEARDLQAGLGGAVAEGAVAEGAAADLPLNDSLSFTIRG